MGRHAWLGILAGVVAFSTPCLAFDDALRAAIEANDLKAVQRIVAARKPNLDDRDPGEYADGARYLHVAASAGNLAITRYLVERGAKVNATDDLGTTPLIAAVGESAGHLAVMKYLLSKGARRDVKNALGLTALGQAQRNGFAKAAALLR